MSDSSRPRSKSPADISFDMLFDDFFVDPYDEVEEQGDEDDWDSEPGGARSPEQQSDYRLILQKVDFLLPQLVDMVRDRTFLDLTPRYQRRFRWKRTKQSLLIESLLLNVPMPSIFLYESEPARYEVMDGRQRLSTITEFFKKDGFRLRGLIEMSTLNGMSYDDLPAKYQSALRRASFPVTIILSENEQEASPRLRQIVFERLNTGGQMLSYQEVRNCIYDGPFNEMLVRVARSELFTKIWGIPSKEKNERDEPSERLRRNRYFATMEDCEIVLRYFAFADVEAYRRPKIRLDAFMKANCKRSKEEISVLETDYLSSIDLAYRIYGDKTFKVMPQFEGARKASWKLSAPFADAVLLACKEYKTNAADLVEHRIEIVDNTEALMKVKSTYDELIGSKNTRVEFINRVNRLKGILGKYQ